MLGVDEVELASELQLAPFMPLDRAAVLTGDPRQRPWRPQSYNLVEPYEAEVPTRVRISAAGHKSPHMAFAQGWMDGNDQIQRVNSMGSFRLGQRTVNFLIDALPGGPTGAPPVSELRSLSGSTDFVLPVYFGNIAEEEDWEYDDDDEDSTSARDKRKEVLRSETVFSVLLCIIAFEMFASLGTWKRHPILVFASPGRDAETVPGLLGSEARACMPGRLGGVQDGRAAGFGGALPGRV